MSQQYNEYLHEHISNVNKGWNWMADHQMIPPPYSFASYQIPLHDHTKWNPEEYEAYDDYFYGKEGKDEDDIAVIDSAFDYAWLHHIHNNPHHWQYWVLINDEDGTKALEMPNEYVYEMIADWWAFSWRSGNLKEIFDWYDSHKEKMILHEKTRKLVESVLTKMLDILGEEDGVNITPIDGEKDG